jgi:hypothetical protein
MPQTIVTVMGRLNRRYNCFRVMKNTVRRERRERKRKKVIQRDIMWFMDERRSPTTTTLPPTHMKLSPDTKC